MRARPLPVASSYPPWSNVALFEVSWEVCNQIGGIYQVLRSKVPTMLERWGDRYFVVGPWLPGMVELEFEPDRPTPWLAPVLGGLAAEGLRVHPGRWMIGGRPRTLLVEHGLGADQEKELRSRLVQGHGIDATSDDPLVGDVLGFGLATQRLLAAAAAYVEGPDTPRDGVPDRILAHFHEWVGGLGLPLLQGDGAPVRTVFTTHATSVGRYIASNEADFYERLPYLESDAEAVRFGITAQHQIERACARACRVFTTVSSITGEECERLLGRKPDIVTPNGLNIDRFELGHEFQTHHAQYKEEIHRFVMGHFFPSYAFDLDKTLYMFNAGRFEPRNKGFDLALEAMARLNAELRTHSPDVTVVFFLVTSRSTRSLDSRVLESRAILDELDEVSQRIGSDVAAQFFRRSAQGETVSLDELVEEYWRVRHRRIVHALRKGRNPLLTTHIIDDPERDPILAHLATLGLANAADDPVKVVYHPEFINSVSPLWGLDYDQFVRGCHAGLFPSSYEPWGYTPLECVAMGIPAVTSDLAGFGRFVAELFPDHDDWGLAVLPRRGRSFDQAAADLTRWLLRFCRMNRRERIALRNQVEAHSRAFDWSRLASAYHEAHDQALAGL